MERPALKTVLVSEHQKFVDMLGTLTSQEFIRSTSEKWSPGQQLEHIYLSVKPVRQAFALPKFILKYLFGKANRPGRNYDELVNKYKQKLEQGGRATGRFVPKNVAWEQKPVLIRNLNREIEKLSRHMDRFSENDLGQYVLPHPLLGKLTLREMLYFTAYHVGHHHQLLLKNLNTP